MCKYYICPTNSAPYYLHRTSCAVLAPCRNCLRRTRCTVEEVLLVYILQQKSITLRLICVYMSGVVVGNSLPSATGSICTDCQRAG